MQILYFTSHCVKLCSLLNNSIIQTAAKHKITTLHKTFASLRQMCLTSPVPSDLYVS
jgi:hypothetical protein